MRPAPRPNLEHFVCYVDQFCSTRANVLCGFVMFFATCLIDLCMFFRPISSSIPLPITSACPNFSLLLFFFVPPPFPLAGREEVVVVVVGRDGLRTTVPDVPSSEMTCRQTTESSVSFQGFRNILLMYRHEQARLRVVAIFRSIVSCTVPLG